MDVERLILYRNTNTISVKGKVTKVESHNSIMQSIHICTIPDMKVTIVAQFDILVLNNKISTF